MHGLAVICRLISPVITAAEGTLVIGEVPMWVGSEKSSSWKFSSGCKHALLPSNLFL